MLRPKKKISKRELKQDALLTSYAKATAYYEQHKKNISIGVTVLVVAIVAILFYAKNQRDNDEKAMTDLSSIYQYYDNGQFQVAIDGMPERNIPGLRSIVDNYGSTKSGDLARFYLANAYFHVGRFQEALEEFEECSPSDQLLIVSCLSGIAGCHEGLGNYSRAAEFYEQASTKYPKDASAAENMSHAAHNYALAGQKEKALDLYKRIKKEYPTSTYARDADRHIARLGLS